MCVAVRTCASYQTSWRCTAELGEDSGLSEGIEQHPQDREEEGQDGQDAHQLQNSFDMLHHQQHRKCLVWQRKGKKKETVFT